LEISLSLPSFVTMVLEKKTTMSQHIFEKIPFNFIWNKFQTIIYFDRNEP
jgi:hypothetical protein